MSAGVCRGMLDTEVPIISPALPLQPNSPRMTTLWNVSLTGTTKWSNQPRRDPVKNLCSRRFKAVWNRTIMVTRWRRNTGCISLGQHSGFLWKTGIQSALFRSDSPSVKKEQPSQKHFVVFSKTQRRERASAASFLLMDYSSRHI